ncbi:ribosome maturation factor RimP [bacterium]|nr:ribosome maturation factor RimP [bacterium]
MIEPVIREENCELVEIRIKGGGSKPSFQIFIDRDTGVSIDDCTRVTKQLTELLDTEFPEIQQYRLEVSSPGTDRPLKDVRDFRKNIGRSVNVYFFENEHERSVEGKLCGADQDKIIIEYGQQMIEVPVSSIRIARIQMQW